jgi:CheY-like chemotaxis protein
VLGLILGPAESVGQRLRADQQPLPTLMTASAMSEERGRCLAAGMDDFISKPVSYKAIEQMITATFSRRK